MAATAGCRLRAPWADGDTHADAHAFSHEHADSHANGDACHHSDSHPDTDGHTNASGLADTHTNYLTDTHSHSYAHACLQGVSAYSGGAVEGDQPGENIMPKPPFDHFRLIAPLYERLTHRMPVEKVRARLDLPVGGWLLDAGGGTGRIAAALRDEVGHAVVADYSAGMIRFAAQKPGVLAVRAAAEALPFATDTFERIVVVDAFHHFHEHEQAARELWCVLAPGGRLVVEEPDVTRPLVKFIALFEKVLLMRSRFYPPEKIADMFRRLGAEATVQSGEKVNAWVIVKK